MTLQAGKMYRPTDVAFDVGNDTVYVVEKFNHRISKWNYTAGSFDFTIDAGQVTTLSLDAAGTGYTVAPTVTITGGGGQGTTATATTDGDTVDSITLTNGGVGYTSIPAVTISAPDTSGTQATASATINGALSFIRPHGVIFDVTDARFDVTDSLRGLITRYSSAGVFQNQLGTPGRTGTDLFYPGSGHGLLNGETVTVFADTRNNNIKTITDDTVAITTGTTSGTGDGELYWLESVSSFTDTSNYVLAANTYNNRMDVFSDSASVLAFQDNFGSP